MKDLRNIILAFVVYVATGIAPAVDSSQLNDTSLDVHSENDAIVVVVSFRIPATLDETWAVLTDYDHMADFLSNVDYSKVISGTETQFLVEQNGKVFLGPFSFTYESVREVTLLPYQEIRYRLISGTFKKLNGHTQLISSGEDTLIIYRGESIPMLSIPRSIVIAMTKRETLEQIENVKREILKRKNALQK
jgi:ribosome-associated toxin RatA of RatAB toxin-antitoxin module